MDLTLGQLLQGVSFGDGQIGLHLQFPVGPGATPAIYAPPADVSISVPAHLTGSERAIAEVVSAAAPLVNARHVGVGDLLGALFGVAASEIQARQK